MYSGMYTEEPSKRCPRCKQAKRLEAFSKDRAKKDGRNVYCRSCDAERWRERRPKRARQRGIPDLPGLPGFGGAERSRAKRAEGKTLEELLEAW